MKKWLLALVTAIVVSGYVGYNEGRAEVADMTAIAVQYQTIALRLSELLNRCHAQQVPTVERHFQAILPTVLRLEGVDKSNPTGYANIPGDHGGETNWGISQRAWSVVRDGTFAEFPESVKDLTRSQARAIYKRVYYLPVFDRLPRPVALVAFDAEVNQNNATRLLDQSLGGLNDSTIAFSHCRVQSTVDNLLWLRLEHYSRLSQKSNVNANFLARFWLPRLITIRKKALEK